jgi:Flp pilus assembly protein TadD
MRIAPQRKSFKLAVLLLCGSVLAGCATTTPDVAKGIGGDTAAGHAKKEADAKLDKANLPTDLEDGVRQAQLMRLAGHYDQAIQILSQLMLVASDDSRVVAEYGKTLAEKGRAQDAVEFLNRAIELSGNDWTLYSALGVSYDQLGNQTAARAAYEHALALHPEEASVLNNYALSRMLAGDPEGAKILIGRSEAAGGGSNAKIAANVAMLNKLAPLAKAPDSNVAQIALAKAQAETMANAAPRLPAQNNAPAGAMPNTVPGAQAMPRQITPMGPPQMGQAAPQRAYAMANPMPQTYAQQNGGVVMQAVPLDPHAGPVNAAHHAAHAKVAEKPSDKTPVKPQTAAVKTASAQAIPTPAAAKSSDKPVKATPVKAAGKDAIPALRMSANAY